MTEYAPLQQLIGILIATDADATTNRIIIYYDTTSTVIDVEEFTGELQLVESLDREIMDTLSFELMALDQGSYQMTGSATVMITIEDINDSVPEVIIGNSQFVDQVLSTSEQLLPLLTMAHFHFKQALYYSREAMVL